MSSTLQPIGSYVWLYRDYGFNYGAAPDVKIPVKPTLVSIPQIKDIGISDDILSGIRIPAFVKVTLYEHPNYGGRSVVLGGESEIEVERLPSYNFNDITSSLKIEPSATPETTLMCCTGAMPPDQCGMYAPGSDACKQNMLSYCATHMNSPVCQKWCTDRPGQCDTIARAYCATNKDAFCSCLNSVLNDTRYGANPACLDQNCINLGGYRTAAMTSGCPALTVTNCQQINQIAAGGQIALNMFNFEQNCGSKTQTQTTQAPQSQPNVTTSINPYQPQLQQWAQQQQSQPVMKSDNTMFWIIIIVVIFGVLLLGGGAIVALIYFADE